jgi:endonuclease/exonuclease/phosphatase family metal-dependent hydrolase
VPYSLLIARFPFQGAIAARFVIDDSSICFINVHLAAGQRQKAARNADLAAIFEDKAVFPPSVESTAFISGGNGSAILDHENVFLSGDLNVR